MPVTAMFVPDQIEVLPNVSYTLTLRLYSDDPVTQTLMLRLTTSGELGDHVRFDAATAVVETNQIVDVPVTMFVPSTVEAGTYTIAAEVEVATTQPTAQQTEPPTQPASTDTTTDVTSDTTTDVTSDATTDTTVVNTTTDATTDTMTDSNVVIATATVVVTAYSDYTIALQPALSGGSSVGRHAVRVANSGNVMIELGLSTEHVGDDISIITEPATLILPPGAAYESSLRVTPATTYWSGPLREHDFVVRATSTDGRSDEMVGIYQQRPRVPNWLGPAAAGAGAALLIGAIAWFALLRPWVQDTADQAAADAIEQDRAALRERIDELEAAAAEAEELPLGSPIDFRLDVAPAGGNTEQATAGAEPGTVLSITDVVFQNPTGAVGTVSLLRGDELVLSSELANFRDFDLHFVAPYVFDDGVDIVFEVECRTPGAGQSACPVGVSLVGFVDEAD